jgi:hypothetical protein
MLSKSFTSVTINSALWYSYIILVLLEMVSLDLYTCMYIHINKLQFRLGDSVDSNGFLNS